MYRHKKAWKSCLSPVPRLEALALPDVVERATRNPRRWVYIIIPIPYVQYIIIYHMNTTMTYTNMDIRMPIKTSHGHLPLLCSRQHLKLARFQDVKNKASK